MRIRWLDLGAHDQAAFRAVFVFLEGRLNERATVAWALQLKPSDVVKRMALLELLNAQQERALQEPWRSAWRMIEESWNDERSTEESLSHEYLMKRRIASGDRSGSLIAGLVDLVRPRLRVDEISPLEQQWRRPRKRARKPSDLLSVRLTSGKPARPDTVSMLSQVADRDLLVSLGHALEGAVFDGLDKARRIGWANDRYPVVVAGVRRVYYVSHAVGDEGASEPDEFSRGLAASVKLLHAVVVRLADVDVSSASVFAGRWKATQSPIHLRLWAAAARDRRLALDEEVGHILLTLENAPFWDARLYPEIAELRARRFGELEPAHQVELLDRIRRLPPSKRRNGKKSTAAEEEISRRYRAARELRRIEVSGWPLPKDIAEWLRIAVVEFDDLKRMPNIEYGFPAGPQVRTVHPRFDERFDRLSRKERLMALEEALAESQRSYDYEAPSATMWIQTPGNTALLLDDLESVAGGKSQFPNVWERFGWADLPPNSSSDTERVETLIVHCRRVLALLKGLPEATLRQVIRGISHWMSSWRNHAVVLPEALPVWLELWWLAVDEANRSTDESAGNDPLNAPVGRMIESFFAACPPIGGNSGHPFQEGTPQRAMRDAIAQSTGRARQIARRRLAQELRYFLAADRQWTATFLIEPLKQESDKTLLLWQEVARQRITRHLLEVLGSEIAERATDLRLPREVRSALMYSVVVDCLESYRSRDIPAVAHARVTQLIRAVDEDVRAEAAQSVQQFVREMPASLAEAGGAVTPESVFASVAEPFLREVWPQERSLSTPGVSRAFADLPAASGAAFADAVAAVDRFLVPFDCWALHDFGFFEEEDLRRIVATVADAGALVRLLDLTIGANDEAVVPHDLSFALSHIRNISPKAASMAAFGRLAAAARRSS